MANVASTLSELLTNVSMFLCAVDEVCSVAQLNYAVYIVCNQSSTIMRFDSTTHQRLTDINVSGLRKASDIAACEETFHLYVADFKECIWRVSSDGEDIECWLPKSPSITFIPSTLSVTATRLLVTSQSTQQLIQFDAGGDELKRIQLPVYMRPQHAIESPAGTFIVSQRNTRMKPQHQVSEVNGEGQLLRQFSGSLGDTLHISGDSQGNVFVADHANSRILLLDAQLALRHVIIDERQLIDEPHRLSYVEQAGQLLVGLDSSVAVFDVLQ